MQYISCGNTSSNFSAEECGYVNHCTNNTEKCLFVQNNTDCQESDGYINYVETLYCTFEGKEWEGIMVYVLWLGFLFVGLATAADDFLMPNLETISNMLRYNQIIRLYIIALEYAKSNKWSFSFYELYNIFLGCHLTLPE